MEYKEDDKVKVISNIIKNVDNNKGDVNLYLLIFNIITDKNSIRNYTNNTNGIFFNMNSISIELLSILNTKIISYLSSKNELNSLEEKRNYILNEMGLTIDNSYKTELRELLNINKKDTKLSTEIESDITDVETEINKKNEIIKTNTRMRKSIEKHNKPLSYKGSYDRINKILSKTRRGYNRNKMILEDDVLFNKKEEQEEQLEEVVEENEIEGDVDEVQEVDEIEDMEEDFEETEEDLFGTFSDEEEKIEFKI